ncbi:MAG: 3'(2'),5'-bisphosphate nucleotidase CysQ [Saprospiraceae bacterium]
MDYNTIQNYCKQLLITSKLAGNAILEIYNSEEIGLESKSDASPLTKADLAANTIICDALRAMSPEIPIISEENENLSYLTRGGWEYCWIVDPLDGTKEFVKKNGEFTTNIALIHGNKVIAGVVYIPVLKEMYFAIKDNGAYQIVDGEAIQLEAKTYTITDKNLKVVCSRSHLNDDTKKFIDKLDNPEMIVKGSSLKFLAIAKGEADLYPRMAPTMEWDTAAAQIILEEAGGSLCNEDSNEPMIYNKEHLLNPFFIARGKEIYIETTS